MWILFWQVLLLLLGKDPADQCATNDEREEGVWGTDEPGIQLVGEENPMTAKS
jgi:hypothetical protein